MAIATTKSEDRMVGGLVFLPPRIDSLTMDRSILGMVFIMPIPAGFGEDEEVELIDD